MQRVRLNRFHNCWASARAPGSPDAVIAESVSVRGDAMRIVAGVRLIVVCGCGDGYGIRAGDGGG